MPKGKYKRTAAHKARMSQAQHKGGEVVKMLAAAKKQALLHGLASGTLHDVLLELRKIYAQNCVIVSKLHNAQVELSALNFTQDRLAGALLELTKVDPVPISEVEAILRDFLFNRHKNDKGK